MKHSAYAPYDVRNENMRVSPFAIRHYPYYIIIGKDISHGKKSSNKPVDLSVAFAVEILNLVKYLKEQKETIICNQNGSKDQ